MLRNRVEQRTLTQGTVTYTLDLVVGGRKPFSSKFPNGATVRYTAESLDGTVYEINEGVLNTGVNPPELSRARLIDSSSGSAINWPDASEKRIFCDVDAELLGPLGGQLLLGTLDGTSTVDAIVVNTAIETPVLKDGMTVWADLTGANTVTTPTLKVNATTQKTIVLPSGGALAAGDLTAGRHLFQYKAATDKWIFLGRPAVTGNFSGTLTSADSSGAGGPYFIADRNSVSPAGGDVLGGFRSLGRNSVGTVKDYFRIDVQIADPVNGGEASSVYVISLLGGAETYWQISSGGWHHGSSGLASKGDGTINAQGLYVAGHGTIAQVVEDTEPTYVTCGTIIPMDDTIPQQTEGDEVLSVSITPTNAGSTLEIDAQAYVGGTSIRPIGAIFVDATASAIAAEGGTLLTNTGQMVPIRVFHTLSAGSQTARTYKMRIGSDAAADAFLNGDSAGRKLGGVSRARLVVREILPQ